MGWELHQGREVEAACGADTALAYAERLRALLQLNGLDLPTFPGMAWVVDRLADGREVAVGIAQGEAGPLAYLFLAEQVRFDRTEERRLLRSSEDGSGTAVTVHWFPPGR